MKEHLEQEGQEKLISSTSDASLYLKSIAIPLFAFLCIAGSIVILAFSFVLLQNNCAGCRSSNEDVDSRNLEAVLGLIAVPLCIIGGLTDFGRRSTRGRRRHRVSSNRFWQLRLTNRESKRALRQRPKIFSGSVLSSSHSSLTLNNVGAGQLK